VHQIEDVSWPFSGSKGSTESQRAGIGRRAFLPTPRVFLFSRGTMSKNAVTIATVAEALLPGGVAGCSADNCKDLVRAPTQACPALRTAPLFRMFVERQLS